MKKPGAGREMRGGNYVRVAKHRGGPIILDYDPLDGVMNIRRFMNDLIKWVLSGRLKHRDASACRGIVDQWLRCTSGDYAPDAHRPSEAESSETQCEVCRTEGRVVSERKLSGTWLGDFVIPGKSVILCDECWEKKKADS